MSAPLKPALPKVLVDAPGIAPPGELASILLGQLEGPPAGVEQLRPLVGEDPELTERLVELANSSVHRTGPGVHSFERACLVLGARGLHRAAVGILATDAIARTSVPEGFDLTELRQRALTTAVAARELARLTRHELAHEAFLGGLLCEVGRLSIALGTTGTNDVAWPSPGDEERELGFHHGHVGEALLDSRGFPPRISRAIARSCEPRGDANGPTATEQLATFLRGGRLATEVLRGESKGDALRALYAVASELGLSRSHLDTVLLVMEPRIEEAKQVLRVTSEATKHYPLLEQARREALDVEAERRARNAERDYRSQVTSERTDADVGLGDATFLDDVLERELRAERDGPDEGIGLLLIDVLDLPKLARDHGGKPANEMLRAVACCVEATSRKSDTPGRRDESTIALIVTICERDGLARAADRLLTAIAGVDVPVGERRIAPEVRIGGVLLVTGPPDDLSAAVSDAWSRAEEVLASVRERGERRIVTHRVRA